MFCVKRMWWCMNSKCTTHISIYSAITISASVVWVVTHFIHYHFPFSLSRLCVEGEIEGIGVLKVKGMYLLISQLNSYSLLLDLVSYLLTHPVSSL